MNITEYKKFINAQLDKVLAEEGDIPVVMWSNHNRFNQHDAFQCGTTTDNYSAPGDRANDHYYGTIFVIGQGPY
jgi:hypothetical protein